MPAFHCRHRAFQHGLGGVHDAGVDVAGHLQVEQVGTVLGVVEGVGGGLVDRERPPPWWSDPAVATMHGKGFEFHLDGSPV